MEAALKTMAVGGAIMGKGLKTTVVQGQMTSLGGESSERFEIIFELEGYVGKEIYKVSFGFEEAKTQFFDALFEGLHSIGECPIYYRAVTRSLGRKRLFWSEVTSS